MALNDILPELLKLKREEMLQAIEILQKQIMTMDKTLIVDGGKYEVWAPMITPETVSILQDVLREAKEQ